MTTEALEQRVVSDGTSIDRECRNLFYNRGAVLYTGSLGGFGGGIPSRPLIMGPRIEPIVERRTIQPINPELDGDVEIDLKKSSLNTYILKQYMKHILGLEEIDDTIALYIHHNRGPGREEEP